MEEKNEEKRNMLIFFAVSLLIMLAHQHFFGNTAPVIQQSPQNTSTPTAEHVMIPSMSSEAPNEASPMPATVAIEEPARQIIINTKSLNGSLSTKGVKLETISLKNYMEGLDKPERVSILGNKKNAYYVVSDWYSEDKSIPLPNEDSVWKASSDELSENSPITLTWDNKNGLLFEKHISIDSSFIITIVDRIKNYGDRVVKLQSRLKIHREFLKDPANVWTFYEGPLGYLNGRLEEISYEDIDKKNDVTYDARGGWFGITDKYWLVAFIPSQNANNKVSYGHFSSNGKKIYSVESSGDVLQVAPSSEISLTNHLFTGAKEIKTLDMYEETLGVKHFDLAIDFGNLYFITKPLLYALALAKDMVGNMGLGILLITLLIKLLLLPLANKSYKSMNRMKKIQPKIQALQKKYANDKAKLGQEVSELYKKENINPIGGCMPSLLQSPVLFALYKVLYISIEMRQAPFIGWIHDLSMPDQLTIFNLFGLLQFDLPEFLRIGIWPILMGISMLLQQKMGPEPADPAQANMMFILPIMFTFMFAQLPAGLVIYWTFSNILSIAQQYYVTRST
ncbi:MAG: membrane protein insertase YidC [Holosporaceae bacterium]|jgi:YidC/Oxa1 family membrane protein insertase|nr:membrane protein insertase YidC [Holosporaceae bacterium]